MRALWLVLLLGACGDESGCDASDECLEAAQRIADCNDLRDPDPCALAGDIEQHEGASYCADGGVLEYENSCRTCAEVLRASCDELNIL